MKFDAMSKAKSICDNWKMFSTNKSDPPLQDLITEALQEAFEQGRAETYFKWTTNQGLAGEKIAQQIKGVK